MLLVNYWAKARLVRVYHEFFEAHLLFVTLQVLREPLVAHQIANSAALLGAERQRVNLLLLLVQWLYSGSQIIGHETVQLVRRRQLTVNNDQRPVEVSRAVDLKLVGEGIAWESIAVALQKQDVQPDVVTLWVLYLTVVLK